MRPTLVGLCFTFLTNQVCINYISSLGLFNAIFPTSDFSSDSFLSDQSILVNFRVEKRDKLVNPEGIKLQSSSLRALLSCPKIVSLSW